MTKKLTPLTDPDNVMVVWDEEPGSEPEPETLTVRRKRLRPAPKSLRRRSS